MSFSSAKRQGEQCARRVNAFTLFDSQVRLMFLFVILTLLGLGMQRGPIDA